MSLPIVLTSVEIIMVRPSKIRSADMEFLTTSFEFLTMLIIDAVAIC